MGKNGGNTTWTSSHTGGRALTKPDRRWSVGRILLLLLGISLFLWGAIAKVAIVFVHLLQGPSG
jgi:hypothetical protein